MATAKLKRAIKVDAAKQRVEEEFDLAVDPVLPVGPLAIDYNGHSVFPTVLDTKLALITKSRPLTGITVATKVGTVAEAATKILKRHGRQLTIEFRKSRSQSVTLTNNTAGKVELIVSPAAESEYTASPKSKRVILQGNSTKSVTFELSSALEQRTVNLFGAPKATLESLVKLTDGYHYDLRRVIELAINHLDEIAEIKKNAKNLQSSLAALNAADGNNEYPSRYDGYAERQRAYEVERLEKEILRLNAKHAKIRLRLEHAVAEATR